ncbi:MAG: helix-turn-helix domain-containing protein [Clostridia bacterium]|nr:helix-turn-helix domain-containing protein [Clostridia bacterium]
MNAEVKSEMDKVFGLILKDYRTRQKLTQAEMAEKLEISDKYVSRVETGTGGISKETLAKYMNILGISPNTMYKEFINNPRIKAEIEVSEQISELSTDKLEVIVEMIKLLKNLKG